MSVENTSIKLSLMSTLLGTAGDFFPAPSVAVNFPVSIPFTNGVGLNQVDMPWSDQRTLASGANEDLDLAAGLTSHLGGALTFARVKAIAFYAAPGNTTNLTVSRPASNGVPFLAAASDAFVLTPGGLFVLVNPAAAGIVVTADTGDLINVANGSGAVATYSVALLGGLS